METKLDSGDEVLLPVDKLVVARLLDDDDGIVLIPEVDAEPRVAEDVIMSVDRVIELVLSVARLVVILVVLITALEIEVSSLVVVT